MLREVRSSFNAAASAAVYQKIVDDLEAVTGFPSGMRICETPLFLSAQLAAELVNAGDSVAAAVLSADHLDRAERAVPPGFPRPAGDSGPGFLSIDFALALDESGTIVPRLIEVQGFPAHYCLMWLLDALYREHVAMPWEGLTAYFSGLTPSTFLSALRDHIVGDQDPRTVVLLEIKPELQKSRIDFAVTEMALGIPTVCATTVTRRGGRLWYRDGTRDVPITRIYNRVVPDDLIRHRPAVEHIFAPGELDVTWVGHPAWFYRVSKFSLPFLDGPHCSPAWFVAEFPDRSSDFVDLDGFVLKPLYSLGGHGVVVAPSREDLGRLDDPARYVLQRRVDYAAAVRTPHGPTAAEVRLMYLCADRPMLTNTFVRLSRSSMMGVDFNKDAPWCGITVAYLPVDGG